MVIDTHIHPALFAPICGDADRFRQRCDEMNYPLMKPSDMGLLKEQYALADIAGSPAAATSKADDLLRGPYTPAGEPQPEGRIRGMIFTAPGGTDGPFD